MKLTVAEVAWCGGIIDIAGAVRVRKTEAGSSLAYVAISTPIVAIAERLAAMTGMKVTIVTRDYKRLGCSKHCTEAHLHVSSVTARWSLTGARAVAFLTAVRPYLVVKADEVDAVLAETASAPLKPRTVEKMRELGWGH